MLKWIIVTLFFVSPSIYAQQKYWVLFTDKRDVEFNPYEYFDDKAIERRMKLNLPLYDETDLPLNNHYITSVADITSNLGKESRWLNAVSVKANHQQLAKISALPFVKGIRPVQKYKPALTAQPGKYDEATTLTNDEVKLLQKQVAVFEPEAFENLNADGKGVRIAVFDGGFPGVDTHPAFEHLRKENRIVKTYDFVKNRPFVYKYMSHGTMVLSCIAGMYNGQKMGLATGAEFLLARTEVKIERFTEEENWLAAVEWADKNGADIINSSLGYTYHRYFTREMDGQTTLVSKAANIAARKGMLVVNAMGNDGNNHWEVVGAPADADSVLSVGGIDPETEYHIYFSSFGPTADKRLKPNISAFGETIVTGKKKYKKAFGTSFAAPLVTGFAACAWQLNPDLTNMELFESIQKSGSLYPYFDYAHGFGIPKAAYFGEMQEEIISTFYFNRVEDFVHVVTTDDPGSGQKEYVYYHIKGDDGVLTKYAVIEPTQKKVLSLRLEDVRNKTLTVHYKGYTEEFKL